MNMIILSHMCPCMTASAQCMARLIENLLQRVPFPYTGANAAGIDSLFVAGGIHAEELCISEAQLIPKQQQLQGLIQEHNVTPQYCMPFLR